MPRLPRIHVENALYFVTSQGGQNQNLFYDKADYDCYIELLGKYKKEHKFNLFAFVLLPQHLHLLIEPKGEATISTIMHDLNSTYTKLFNSRYKKKGHLFQGRYKAKVIEKEGYMLSLTRYFHCLPQKARLVDNPQDYPYCSYNFYLSIPQHKLLEMKDEIIEVLSTFQEADKAKAYEDYVNSADQGEIDKLDKLLKRKHFLGSEQFIVEIKRKIEYASTVEEVDPQFAARPNKAFVLVGSMVILLLGTTTIRLYTQNLGWQHQLDATTKEFSQNFIQLQTAFKEVTEPKTPQLNGSVWEVKLAPIRIGEVYDGPNRDRLSFKDGQLTSERLNTQGFNKAEYSFTKKPDGSIVWQTAHTKPDGTKAIWYGIWSGKRMKGLLSERPVQGENRDFSFVSTKQIKG